MIPESQEPTFPNHRTVKFYFPSKTYLRHNILFCRIKREFDFFLSYSLFSLYLL